MNVNDIKILLKNIANFKRPSFYNVMVGLGDTIYIYEDNDYYVIKMVGGFISICFGKAFFGEHQRLLTIEVPEDEVKEVNELFDLVRNSFVDQKLSILFNLFDND